MHYAHAATTPGLYNNHYQIFQAPGYVVILMEMIHDARISQNVSDNGTAILAGTGRATRL